MLERRDQLIPDVLIDLIRALFVGSASLTTDRFINSPTSGSLYVYFPLILDLRLSVFVSVNSIDRIINIVSP